MSFARDQTIASVRLHDNTTRQHHVQGKKVDSLLAQGRKVVWKLSEA